jgi:hypothetical protein
VCLPDVEVEQRVADVDEQTCVSLEIRGQSVTG